MSELERLLRAPDPLARARQALEILWRGGRLGPFPLDHVGWFETPEAVAHIVSALGMPTRTFPSRIVAEELGQAVQITRIVSRGRELELFAALSVDAPARAHLAFRAPDRGALERAAARSGVPVRRAADGSLLVYLSPAVEIILPSAPSSAKHRESRVSP